MSRAGKLSRTGIRGRIGSPRAFITAFVCGLAATGVAADTLAQPPSTALERAAADYIRFREDVEAVEKLTFDNAEITREAHRRLAAHDSTKLAAGWVAYAALVAADNEAFAKAIEDELDKKPNRRKGELGGRDGLLSNLAQDPSYLRNLDGANDAIEQVLSMTLKDGARITALGEAFKAQAYAMQKTRWGKARIAGSQERLNEAQQYSRSRPATAAPDFQRRTDNGVTAPALASASSNWAADWGASAGPGRMTEQNATVIMDRILNLAARYNTGVLNDKVVEVYAKNNKTENCLSLSKLTLDQCIAATRAPYEEAFCLGEHALNDISTCMGWVAGAGAS